MHKYICLFFSVSVMLFGCKGSNAPAGIIDRDRMTSLLTAVHITDGSVYTIRQDPDSLYKYGTGKFLGLFQKYHTDSAQFRKSLQYYASDPQVLEAMYNQILDNLKHKTDSLNKAIIKTRVK